MEPLTPLPSISRACTMEPQHKSPAFGKPYLPDCETRLQIHPTFSPFMESSVPEKASLRNRKGKIWPVEVAKIGDNFYFQQGWKIFIEENHIEYGDLLACHYKGDKIFDLKNLGKEATQKQINEAFDFKGKEKQEPADDVQNQTTLKRKAADFENFDEYYCYNYRKTGHTNGYPYFVMKSKKRNKKGGLVLLLLLFFKNNYA